MQTRSVFAIVGAALLLLGCGEAADTSERAAPLTVEETAFGDTVGTIDKARSVEGAVLRQKDDTDRAIQENEG